MKSKILTILLLFISSVLFGQIPKGILSLEDSDYNKFYLDSARIPIVKGQILNLAPEDLRKVLITYSIVTPFENLQNKKVTNVRSDGTFNLQLDYPFPYQQIWLSIGDTLYTCLYANSDLFIELDAEKVDRKNGIMFNGVGIKFLGSDGELTNLMNNHILFKRKQQLEISNEISTLRSNKPVSTEEYLVKYNELYSRLNEIDNEFIKKNPSDYSGLILNERLSRYYSDLFSLYLNKQMDNELWEKVKNHKSYAVSNEGSIFYRNLLSYLSIRAGKYQITDWSPIRKYSLIDENGKSIIDSLILYQKALNLKSYGRLLNKAFTVFSDTLSTINTLKTIKLLDSTFDPAKADFLKIKIGNMDKSVQQGIYDLVFTNLTTDWCKSVINSENQILKERLLSVKTILSQSKQISSVKPIGDPIAEMPFDAKLYKVNNLKAPELLSNLKEAFNGKALVIDFWATWCAPCLSDLPYSKKLHDSTKDLPVEYIYLCTSNNSTLDKWKSKIAELEIPGTHIFVEERIETELMNLFSVNGFPSIVFINKNGAFSTGAITTMSRTDKTTMVNLINKK